MMKPVYLDTNAIISAFETHDAISDWMWRILDAVADRRIQAVTSEVTLAELLPKPMSLGQSSLIEFYEAMLSEHGDIATVPVTRDILVETARLRSNHMTLRLPDAIHLVSAATRRCPAFLSNDRRLPQMADMTIVRLGPSSIDDIQRLTA